MTSRDPVVRTPLTESPRVGEIRALVNIPPGAVVALLVGLVAAMGIYRIETLPPPWWDEGWTLSVARNWVESGHYGHLLLGAPTAPSLAAHFPVVAIVAGGFLLFGIGLLQARLMMLVWTVVMLLLLAALTRKLFPPKVMVITVLLACWFPIQWEYLPALFGRQVLGEVPSMVFILAGFLALLRSAGEKKSLLLLAMVSFGVALLTKAQVRPFLLFGLWAPALLLFTRYRSMALRLVGVAAGAVVTSLVLDYGRAWLLTGRTVPGAQMSGLTEAAGFVVDPALRLSMLQFAAGAGLPVTLALLWNLWKTVCVSREVPGLSWQSILRMMLFLLTAAWFAWYVAFSIGWGRYGYPPFVLATPFVALLLTSLWDTVRGRLGGHKDGGVSAVWNLPRGTIRSGALIVLLALSGLLLRQSVLAVSGIPALDTGQAYAHVVNYLNKQTPTGSTVESYESELLFLVDRPFTFPPPQVNVSLILWSRGDTSGTSVYAPEEMSTDYLVVGDFGRGVYRRVVQHGSIEEVAAFGPYRVYRPRDRAE